MNLMSGFGSGVTKSLIFRFIADTAKATKDIERLTNKIKRAQGLAAGKKGVGADKLKDEFNKMGTAGVSAFDRIKAAIGPAGAALIGFGLAMRQTFKFGTLVENSLTALEVLQGNAKKARETMREAMKFSLLTPFTPAEVFAATQAAAQYNVDLYKKGSYGLSKDQNVAQILAGMGSFVDLNGEKIGMGRAAHAVMRGDYRLLRQYRGLVNPAFEEAKTAGKVGTPEFTAKFIEGLGKIPQIMEMAKKQSETVAGLWSTIVGFGEQFWMYFSGAAEEEGVQTFWSNIRDILREIRDFGISFMDTVGPALTDIGAALGAVFKTLWIALTRFTSTKIWNFILFIIRAIAVVIEYVASVIGKIFDFFGKIFNKIGEITDALTGFDKKKDKTSIYEDAIAYLKAQAIFGKMIVDWALNKLWKNISDAIDKFKEFIKTLKEGGITGVINKQIDDANKNLNEEYYKGPEGSGRLDRMKEKYGGASNPKELERQKTRYRKEMGDLGMNTGTTNIFNVTNPIDVHNNLNHGRPGGVPSVPGSIKEAWSTA